MKYFQKIVALILLSGLIGSTGCKSKIDLAPNNAFDANSAFSTPERCLLALNGVYDAAQSGTYDPFTGAATVDRGYPFGAAAIEQEDMRGEDMVNVATFYQATYFGTYTTVSPNNVNMWKELYALINKANLSIAGFRAAAVSGTLTLTVAAQYEAECRFLRAMAHHELLLHFARPYADGSGTQLGVPYRDFAINNPQDVALATTKPRESVANCYTKMLADLDYSEANLPATGVNFRATKAAAIALKMRLKLHKGDWAGVITEGNKIIPAAVTPLTWTTVVSPIGGWFLTPNADGPFVDNASKESIFSIKNDPIDNPGTNASLARMYSISSTATGGRGLVSISPIVWNLPEWTCGDKRRTLLYANGNDNAGNQNKFTIKYKDQLNQSDWAPYIRYAEVFLIQAEAEARSGGVTQRAVDLLNMVRNRALANVATETYTTASFANQNALINAIIKEKRIEFLAEGKRWSEIHRLSVDPAFTTAGVPDKMANGFANLGAFVCAGPVPATGVPAIPYADYRFLWPIPQQERNTNPIVDQNPGY